MSNEKASTSEVRKRLVALRDELRNRVSRVNTDLQHSAAPLPADFADRAIETGNEAVLEKIGSSAQEELAQIDTALQRLDAGQYGRCAVCNGPIEAARLAAVPYAVTCSRCA